MQISISILVANATSGISYVKRLVKNFKARVLSYPNSIFEAEPCLVATLTELNNIELLRQSSLVITPNAYNEGVLYDVIPNTTLGDMDVVRATTATRVNSAGLIEIVPRNLFTYSQDFTNAAWLKRANITIEANSIAAPNGTITASKLKVTDNNTVDYGCFQIVTSGTNRTLSVYAKKAELNYLFLGFNNDNANEGVFFDLNNGTISRNTGSFTASIQDIGDGWYRCSALFTNISYCFISPSVTGTSFVFNNQINKGIYIWGAQLENFATATEYFPTTTRLNIPRIDYTNGSCPSLLVEPQRTNISAYVESGTAGYTAATVISAPSILGLNSFKVTTNSIFYSDSPFISTNSQFQANTPYTVSFYTDFSKCTGTEITINFLSFFTGIAFAGININKTTKAITTNNVGGVWTLNSYSATQINGEIYRIILTATPNATAAAISRTYINTNDLFSIELSGVQVEAGAYPTSFINKPSGSSVTRNADVISKTGVSSLIGQTEGTIFADIDYDANIGGTKIITGLASSGSSFIYSFISGTTLVLSVYNSGILQCYLTYALPSSGKYKIAIGYKLNDFIVYVNGANVVSQTSGTVPTCSIIYVGNDFLTVLNKLNYNSVQLYKTRLTDEQLTLLTGDTYNSYAEMANSLNYILE